MGASYEGLIDLARSDPRDPSWPATLVAASTELARRRASQVLAAQIQVVSSYLAIPNLTDESLRSQISFLDKTAEAFRANVEPWAAGKRDENVSSKADRLAAYYRQVVSNQTTAKEGGDNRG